MPQPLTSGGAQPVFPVAEDAGVERGDDRALPDLGGIEIVVVEGAYLTAGFAQDQAAGRVIPEHLAAMKIEVEATGGEVAPFQGRAAEVALREVGRVDGDAVGQPFRNAFEVDVGDGSRDVCRNLPQRQAASPCLRPAA